MLTKYLKLNDGYTVKGEVEAVSTELTAMAKQPAFLDVAIRSLQSEPPERNRLVFVTSLVKDKFKFDFELVPR